jgi:hypothetical protein
MFMAANWKPANASRIAPGPFNGFMPLNKLTHLRSPRGSFTADPLYRADACPRL